MGAFRFRQPPAEPDLDLLPPERVARPARRRPFAIEGDISDAEFVTVRETPRRQFDARRYNDNIRSAARLTDLESSRPARGVIRLVAPVEAGLSRFSDMAFAVMVAVVFICVFLLAGAFGHSGASARSVLKPGLAITHVTIRPQEANGMRVLAINAIVENRGAARAAVPLLRADLIANGGLVASTLIAAPVEGLEGGKSRGFSAKIQHPGGKMPELRLSFAETDAPPP